MRPTSLWVDDIRSPPSHINCDVARTYDEAINFLTNNQYETIYLDHDLADFKDGKERTGYSLVLWLVEQKLNNCSIPSNYIMLTANPIGRANMMSVINRYLI